MLVSSAFDPDKSITVAIDHHGPVILQIMHSFGRSVHVSGFQHNNVLTLPRVNFTSDDWVLTFRNLLNVALFLLVGV